MTASGMPPGHTLGCVTGVACIWSVLPAKRRGFRLGAAASGRLVGPSARSGRDPDGAARLVGVATWVESPRMP